MGNKILSLIFALMPFMLWAQPWESFQLTSKGDTINRIDQKKLKQGPWLVHVDPLRGEAGFEEEGYFENDKKEGPWRKFTLQGDLTAIENYRWGNRDGKQQYFSNLGDLIREEGWKSVNPENPYDTIDVPDLNNPMVTISKVIKHETAEVRHGTWKYFDPTNGMILKTEYYSYGQKDKGFGTNSSETQAGPTTPAANPSTKPKAVEEWEKKNSGKKKVVVRDGRTGGG